MTHIAKKTWTVEETCTLIEIYRSYECLWNPAHTDYKHRVKKRDALDDLAKMFDTSSIEIERKITNINSQYRRERRNYKTFQKSGAASNFHSKWFGYKLMSFLHDKNKARNGQESGLDDSLMQDPIVSADDTNEIGEQPNEVDEIQVTIDETEGEETNVILPKNPIVDNTLTPPNRERSKSKRNSMDKVESRMEDAYRFMKNVCDMPDKDICSQFAELMATKLRAFDELVRDKLMNDIDNLIFKAKMPQPIQSIQSIPSTSSSGENYYHPHSYSANPYFTPTHSHNYSQRYFPYLHPSSRYFNTSNAPHPHSQHASQNSQPHNVSQPMTTGNVSPTESVDVE